MLFVSKMPTGIWKQKVTIVIKFIKQACDQIKIEFWSVSEFIPESKK